MKRYRVTIDGRSYDVEIDDPRARPVTARLDGVAYTVDVHAPRAAAGAVERPEADGGPAAPGRTQEPGVEGDGAPAVPAAGPDGAPAPGVAATASAATASAGGAPQPIDGPGATGAVGAEASPQTMTAPIPGVVASVVANVGQVVKRGDELLTLEAMKMFNVLRSPWAGTVTTLHVSKGEHVIQGQPLVTFGRR